MRAVEQDHPAAGTDTGAEQGDDPAGHRRADHPAEVERRRVEGDGVGERLAADHLVDERLAGRRVERRGGAEGEGDDVDVPRLDDTGDGEDAEECGSRRHGDLRHHHHRALGEAVGDHPGDRREQQDRQELQAGRQAEGAGAAGEGEDEPVLGDALHPGPGVGDQRPGGEQPVVADPQGGERRLHAWLARRSRSGATAPQQVTFVRVEVGEVDGEPGVAAPAVLVEHGPGVVGESDDDLATVGLVGGAGDEPDILEAVDGARHRRRLDLLDRRQLADRQVAVAREGAEGGQLGERQVAAAAFEAQPPGEPHHADTQCRRRGRRPRRSSVVARWSARLRAHR